MILTMTKTIREELLPLLEKFGYDLRPLQMPSLEEVREWLRKKKGLSLEMVVSGDVWTYRVAPVPEKGPSYEESLEKGVEDVLRNWLRDMKLEKTCRCIKGASLGGHEFLEKKEYQVDILVQASGSTYKVYRNGGWDDYVTLPEEEFKEYFEEIE